MISSWICTTCICYSYSLYEAESFSYIYTHSLFLLSGFVVMVATSPECGSRIDPWNIWLRKYTEYQLNIHIESSRKYIDRYLTNVLTMLIFLQKLCVECCSYCEPREARSIRCTLSLLLKSSIIFVCIFKHSHWMDTFFWETHMYCGISEISSDEGMYPSMFWNIGALEWLVKLYWTA